MTLRKNKQDFSGGGETNEKEMQGQRQEATVKQPTINSEPQQMANENVPMPEAKTDAGQAQAVQEFDLSQFETIDPNRTYIEPPNPVDKKHLQPIKDSMEERGWVGRPLLLIQYGGYIAVTVITH